MADPLAITIVTTCRNAAGRLRETAASVLGQRALTEGRATLQYVVLDAASTDETATVLGELAAAGAEVRSEPDRGLYDGLAKGFRRARGEVMGWLNAGDALHPGAFDALVGIFTDPTVDWITGVTALAHAHGTVVRLNAPWHHRRGFIRAGLHDGKALPFIQQESTFWRRRLLDDVDLDAFARFRLAGDGWLWAQFARTTELTAVHALLGEFRRHPGQLSADQAAYRAELAQACAGHGRWWRRPLTLPDRLLWTLDQGWKLRLDRTCRRWDGDAGRWSRP